MFLDKYLNNFYYDLVFNSYESSYLLSLEEKNFSDVYTIFNKYNFYFINDIILNYIELFQMNPIDVETGILKLKNELGNDFVYIIGSNMKYLNKIII